MIKILKLFLLLTVVVFTIAMYHPLVFQTPLYDQFRLISTVVLACLVLLTFSTSKLKRYSFIKSYIFFVVFISIELLFFYSLSLNVVWLDLVQLVMVFFFILIGLGAEVTKKTFFLICTIYIIAALLLAVTSINYYLGGFNLEANQFLIEGKNQLGVIVAVGGGISFYLCHHSKGIAFFTFVSLAIAILFALLIIRCRTALVAYVLFAIIYVWLFWPKNRKTYFFIALIGISILNYETIVDIIDTVLFNNEEITDVNALSTSRFNRNIQGLAFLSNHFFTGELIEKAEIGWIHNYVLLKFVRYGIWALPFLGIYLVFVVQIIKSLIHKENDLLTIGVYVLIIPFICSLLEPSAPFGPGTVQITSYLLFGIYLNKKKEIGTCCLRD